MLKAQNLIPKHRYLAANIVVIFLMLTLFIRFFQIQIYRHEKFKQKADVNRIRAVTVNAPRGLIFDRNGELLVDNYPTYVLTAIPGEIGAKEERFKMISDCTGIDSVILTNNFEKYRRGKFIPARLAKDLTFEQISILEENKLELAGISYDHIPERFFPSDIRGSHFLGYVQEVDRDIRVKLENKEQYELGDLTGVQGLEKVYESRLRGTKGVTYFEVDAFGRVVGKINGENEMAPIPGKNITVTIDAALQKLLEMEMESVRGVAIASDPRSGEILAYVSAPDYPPELFTGSTPEDVWAQVLADTNQPLLDRVSGGLYPPGSTFKMLTTVALLEKNLLDPKWSIECVGNYKFGDRTFRCWKEEGHGQVQLYKALSQSCNVYFYNVVQRLTFDEWANICLDFGFAHQVGIDLPSEQIGVIPTKTFMNEKYGRRGWSLGNLLNMVIGQGDILVTPLQILKYINLLATHGNSGQLHILADKQLQVEKKPHISETTWSKIDVYLQAVVADQNGTGRTADPQIPGVIIAGKTGTAENPHGQPHAWFIGYGERGERLISLVILVENGGHGGETATPIARKAFELIYSPNKQFAMIGR